MTGIVVTGGDYPRFKYVKEIFEKSDMIVAADSGLDTLHSYGIAADYVLGDMDSLKNKDLLHSISAERVLKYPVDKDFTDTELALEFLHNKGCETTIIIGGGGGRFDHQIALYSLFSRDRSPHLWITANEQIHLVENSFSIKLNLNTAVSLFPVGINPCRMTSNGLKWELNNLKWTIGDSGISNIALNESIIINMKSGRLIMIIALENH